ncbi:MAG: hypothetical protein JW719_10185 [Pirellulales bacterium]|nr:hypothetical protein [Pirellulales bacterium]
MVAFLHLAGVFVFLLITLSITGLAFFRAPFGERPRTVDLIVGMTITTLLATIAGLGVWGHLRWSENLDRWRRRCLYKRIRRERRPFQVYILELLLLMTAVALVAGMASWMIRMSVYF